MTDEQSALLTREAIDRAQKRQTSIACPSCKAKISSDAKFCPNCGSPISSNDPPHESEFKIPTDGYAVEFCESSSARFPDALKIAQGSPSFSSAIKNKKTWYFASWPESAFENVTQIAEALSGLRNKKCYHNGAEAPWDELFGFIWCASGRDKAYRPTEYCFGKSENQLNPWGCKQVRMDWTEWARWFSYGHFESKGLLGRTRIWVFDKTRIQHELLPI